ncbi:juvenile hormone esterase-like [Diorhabda sublineata]|uniref:juvenile hormone esterase-like n=1 Tax=Diorhabda sublineata TaxID=1163346 RepID=UPI0024E15B31|nr:juvenile hormone esterase-like [Diorhabda sublineata]
MLLTISLTLFLFASIFEVKCDNDDLIVQLEKGKIRGHILKSEKGNDYYAFQEIPYAMPPVGEYRFEVPRESEPWEGIIDTTKNTKMCYQHDHKYPTLISNEDCLYLNVYTPVKPGSDDILPVLFVIHGGGLGAWSGSIDYFGPKYVMDYGIVVVTINYRLGPFGFVGTDDGAMPLNLGFKDQRFAMEWVNKNIRLFGGNPNQVTIGGESAGAMSIGYHMLGDWPDNKELFHAVIMQSGNAISGGLVQDNPTEIALQLGKAVDSKFGSSDTAELRNLLKKATADDILMTNITGGIAIEKDGPFSYRAYPSFLNGNYKKVPVLIGFNSEEMSFLALSNNDAQREAYDKDPSQLINDLYNMSPENKTIAGTLLKQIYTFNTSFLEDKGGYTRYNSDKSYTLGTCKQVELGSSVVPYYFYQFSYKGYLGGDMSNVDKLPPDVGKVGHTEDLRYMWDDGSNSDLSKFPEEDQLMLHRYVTMWTNFVKYFNPTPENDPLLDNMIWTTTEPNTMKYLNINSTFKMRTHPRQYSEVKQVIETYMQPPYTVF